MKRNGFTFIEMLVAVVVICVIAMIALPMKAVRAKKLELVHAKMQLMQIKESQTRSMTMIYGSSTRAEHLRK